MPHEEPILLYDGDCEFCRRLVQRWQRYTEGNLIFLPYQQYIHHFPQVTKEACSRAIQLIYPNGSVDSAGKAAFYILQYHPKYHFIYAWYHQSKLFAACIEGGYWVVARTKGFLNFLGF